MAERESLDELRFGEFRAVSILGRGATSTVYLAEKTFARTAVNLDGGDGAFPDLMVAEAGPAPQRAAVKVVNFTAESTKLSRRFRKLFATEAWVASQLDHPNITKVFAWKVEDERAYLVMEHLEGQTLDSYVSLDKLLPVQQVVDIIHKVAVALDYAHRCGVVNRDVKPANVMLCANGDVKVMDFGLALNIKKNVDIDSTYINGLGSPSYMSPEQIKGYTLNHQTDLYSLGVMFYQLLTGRLPFRAKNTAALIYQIINMSPVPVTQLNPELPEFTQLVIAKSMEKDLYSRYRLGAHFAKDLSDAPYQRVKANQNANLDVRWEALRALTSLGGIEDIDLWELLRASNWRELAPATVIMREGDEGNSFGIVVKGLIELENGDRAFTVAQRGELVGATEWLDKGAPRRMCTATTLDSVTYLEVNPAAFEYATEELAEVVQRLAMESVLKRLRVATRLARAQSPLAIHPAPVPAAGDVPDAVEAAPPERPLGWGVFAAMAPAAQVAPAVPTKASPSMMAALQGMAAAAPAPAMPLAPTSAPVAAAPVALTPSVRPTSVAVQPLPAAAAAAIAQLALGRPPQPPAAFHLDASASADFTDVPLLPEDEGASPAASAARAGVAVAAAGLLTAEMAPDYSATTTVATTEMAPNYSATTTFDLSDFAVPAILSALAQERVLTAPRAMPAATPHRGVLTTELAPEFAKTSAFDANDFALPSIPAENVPAAPLLAPFALGGADSPGPAGLAKPLAKTARDKASGTAPEFDPDKTSVLSGGFGASGEDDGKFAEDMSPPVNAPAPAPLSSRKTAARPVETEDLDKTVEISGGFAAQPVEEDGPLDHLFPPIKF